MSPNVSLIPAILHSAYIWKKIMKLDTSLLKKLEKALPERQKQVEGHDDFESGLVRLGVDVEPWRASVEAWEVSRSNANPYRPTVTKKSERAIRLELSKEASKDLDDTLAEQRQRTGTSSVVGVDVDAATMLGIGLDLEELQTHLGYDVAAISAEKATAKQLTDLIDRSNQLRRRIAAWVNIQAVHMPETTLERERSTQAHVEGVPGVSAHNIPLCLPSVLASRTSRYRRPVYPLASIVVQAAPSTIPPRQPPSSPMHPRSFTFCLQRSHRLW